MPMPLSHSKIESWDDCRLYFRALYIEKVPQPKTPPLMMGNFFHDWAARYVGRLKKDKQQTDLSFGRSLFESMWEGRSGSRDYGTLPERYFGELSDMVNNFLATHAFDPEKIAGVEVELAFDQEWKLTEWLAPNVFFRMKIDRVDMEMEGDEKVITITDYKTSWAAEGEEQTPKNAQLRRYVFGADLIMKAQRYRVALDYPRLRYTRAIDMDLEEAQRERSRIESVSRTIERAIKANDFPATPGWACTYCPIFNRCPSKNQAEDFVGVKTEAEAVQALQRLVMLERDRKAIQAALQAYAGAAGFVKSGGMKYGPNPKVTRDYNVDQVEAWRAKHGLAHPGLLKVSNEEMAKLLKKLDKPAKAGNVEALEAIAQAPQPSIKTTTEYRLLKDVE